MIEEPPSTLVRLESVNAPRANVEDMLAAGVAAVVHCLARAFEQFRPSSPLA